MPIGQIGLITYLSNVHFCHLYIDNIKRANVSFSPNSNKKADISASFINNVEYVNCLGLLAGKSGVFPRSNRSILKNSALTHSHISSARFRRIDKVQLLIQELIDNLLRDFQTHLRFELF